MNINFKDTALLRMKVGDLKNINTLNHTFLDSTSRLKKEGGELVAKSNLDGVTTLEDLPSNVSKKVKG